VRCWSSWCFAIWVTLATVTLRAEGPERTGTPVAPRQTATASAQELDRFEKNVRPLLLARCSKCHGEEKSQGGLRLDSAAALAAGGDSGPVVAAGKPDDSLLIQAVRQTGELKMPPDGKLNEREVAELVAWVAAGAIWPGETPELRTAAIAKPPVTSATLLPNDAVLAPHLVAWYKADALPLADGQPLQVWPDSSGRGHDLTATAGVRAGGVGQPPRFVTASDVHRRPAVRFTPESGLAGSPDHDIDIHGDASVTIFLVVNLKPNDASPPYDGILGIGDPANPTGDPGRPLALLVQINRDAENHALHLAGGWNHDATLGPASFMPLYEKSVILAVSKTPGPIGDTTRFYFDGVPSEKSHVQRPASGRETVPDIRHRTDIGLYLGKALSWSGSIRGDVAEAIVYNTALADAEREAVEAYLADKYALVTPRMLETAAATFTAEQKAFWAFQPVVDPPLPEVKATGWTTSPIDRFILEKLEQQRLSPAPPADKRTLLRRVTFDLIGLPPTPEEIDAFLADQSSDALAKVVDRLLRSPHYGERWGRHWLDVVRYAESTANDANAVMQFAFRYRDYVVDAFNRDLPYDQFIIEQLAGDLLPPTTDINEAVRRVIATGYLMIGPKALAETDKEQSRLDIVDDQIDVTGRTFLGLTLACARCHDHKFDPVPTVDYYSLAGIFRSTEPFMDEARNATMWWEFPLFQAPGEQPFVVMAPKEGRPVNLRVHLRGNRFNLGQVAPRRFLQIVAGENHSPPATNASGRLELARWIAAPQNPLTARVMVNRVWQHHFGRALVATSDNFGSRGERPSHPELLDWLAARFVERGWSVKALHKLMLLSSTYQMASASDAQGELLDPDDRLLWRMPRRRLEAEILRDALLAAGGRLDAKVGGGESSEFLWKQAEVLGGGDIKIRPNTLKSDDPFYSTSNRRSLYLPVVRNMLPDVLALFDAADPNGVTAVRNDTTVPAQALFMLNHPYVREQALYFARLLLADGKLDEPGRIALAYVRAFGRPPEAEELSDASSYLHDYATRAAALGKNESETNLVAWQSFCQSLLCANEFLYVD